MAQEGCVPPPAELARKIGWGGRAGRTAIVGAGAGCDSSDGSQKEVALCLVDNHILLHVVKQSLTICYMVRH